MRGALSFTRLQQAPRARTSASGARRAQRPRRALNVVASAPAVAVEVGAPAFEAQANAGEGQVAMMRYDLNGGKEGIKIVFEARNMNNMNGMELHWAVVMEEGDGDWVPPPEDALTPAGTTGFGDGIASRSKFENKKCEITFPAGASTDAVARVCAIVVRGEEWLHAEGGDLIVPMRKMVGSVLAQRLAQAEKPGWGGGAS